MRYGRWTVLERVSSGSNIWVACDCGSPPREVNKYVVMNGRSKSCGCLRREMGAARGLASKKHGHAGSGSSSPEYQAWAQMKHRCLNPSNPQYANYGARGIRVCVRWLNSFENFFKDVGSRPEGGILRSRYSLGRIDNDGDYEPTNVRWETTVEQNNNTRSNHRVVFRGEEMSVSEACERFRIPRRTYYGRLKSGMSQEDALLTPLAPVGRNVRR
jgi:hypothetical protein